MRGGRGRSEGRARESRGEGEGENDWWSLFSTANTDCKILMQLMIAAAN